MKRMLAYSPLEFRNFLVTEDLKRWKKDTDRKDLAEKLQEHYKTPVHSTNFFIRLALALFTFILASVIAALLGMVFRVYDYDGNAGVFSIFMGIALIAVLEFYIHTKKSYRSGIDDMLLYLAYAALITAYCIIFYPENYYEVPASYTAFIISAIVFSGIVAGAGAIRYNDMLAAITSWTSFIGAILIGLYNLGNTATAFIPFAAALAGGVSYYIFRSLRRNEKYILWDSCLWLLEIMSLLLFYCSLNYFVVETLTIELLDVYPEEGQRVVPLGWLFYITTAVIPCLYMYVGIKQKNRILFRAGLVLVAAAALTFKYYFSTGHHEITLTASGAIVLLICAALHKFLKTDKGGITLKEDDDEPFRYIDAESLVIVQSFGQGHNGGSHTNSGTEFGDGKFGGGGATDEF